MNLLRRAAAELHRRDPLLSGLGWVLLAVLAVTVCLAPFDSRSVLGINPWIKPAKFLISITVFVWTVGWLLHPLRGPRWAKMAIRVGIALSMAAEVVWILLQSARGVRSHFNFDTGLDAALFGAMGSIIGINTFLMAGMLLLYLIQRPNLSSPYLWGIRLGLVLFLLASFEGVIMIASGAHAVGVADGGEGLPFVNWSTAGGDLRVAHFVGLHGLQAIPLFGWLWSRWAPAASRRLSVAVVFGFAVAYAGLGCALFVQAVAGRPLLSL